MNNILSSDGQCDFHHNTVDFFQHNSDKKHIVVMDAQVWFCAETLEAAGTTSSSSSHRPLRSIRF